MDEVHFLGFCGLNTEPEMIMVRSDIKNVNVEADEDILKLGELIYGEEVIADIIVSRIPTVKDNIVTQCKEVDQEYENVVEHGDIIVSELPIIEDDDTRSPRKEIHEEFGQDEVVSEIVVSTLPVIENDDLEPKRIEVQQDVQSEEEVSSNYTEGERERKSKIGKCGLAASSGMVEFHEASSTILSPDDNNKMLYLQRQQLVKRTDQGSKENACKKNTSFTNNNKSYKAKRSKANLELMEKFPCFICKKEFITTLGLEKHGRVHGLYKKYVKHYVMKQKD